MHDVVVVAQSNYYECGTVFCQKYASVFLLYGSAGMSKYVIAFSIPSEHTHRPAGDAKWELLRQANSRSAGERWKELKFENWITWCEPPEENSIAVDRNEKLLRSSKTWKFMFIRILQQPFGDAEIVGRPFGCARTQLGVCVCLFCIYHLLLFIYYFRFSGSDILYRVARVGKRNESWICFGVRNVGTECQLFFFSSFFLACEAHLQKCVSLFWFLEIDLVNWSERQSGAVIT